MENFFKFPLLDWAESGEEIIRVSQQNVSKRSWSIYIVNDVVECSTTIKIESVL